MYPSERPFIAEWPGSPTCLHNRARSEPCPACDVLAGAPGQPTPQIALYAASLGDERPRGVTFDRLFDAEPVCHCGLTVSECEARGLEPCPEDEISEESWRRRAEDSREDYERRSEEV